MTDLITAARSGRQLISFPTDTVPALAVRPDRADLIFEAKQRSLDKPLILMGADADDLWPYVAGSHAEQALWRNVAQTYWPGALTLVLPTSDRMPKAMNPLDPSTLGIRVPACAIARQILAQTGPLATTSVNRSGEPPLTTFDAIHAQFPEVLTLSPEELESLENLERSPSGSPSSDASSPSPQGIPSTVAKWTGHRWEIVRQGAIQL